MIIIAVDDEAIGLKNLCKSIQSASPDAEIHSFTNPQEALLFATERKCDLAFLDIQMRGMDGLQLAKQMKMNAPHMNIIFATGYSEYAMEAYNMNASGYLLKPITAEKVLRAMDELRYPLINEENAHIRIRCFGEFEVFIDNKPLFFQHDKAKELLAYLVDRHGAVCSTKELCAGLWGDESHDDFLQQLKKELTDILEENDCGDLLIKSFDKFGLNTAVDYLSCDYYDWLRDLPRGINAYTGEYMKQYRWAEYTAMMLQQV